MVKKQGSKTTGGTPPKKWFSYKKNKKKYDGYAKQIKAFCKKSENRGLNKDELARRASEKLGFNNKSFGAITGYIGGHGLVSAATEAAAKEAKVPAHARIDLKTVKVGDMITVQDDFAVVKFSLKVRRESSVNKHPKKAFVHLESVRIEGDDEGARVFVRATVGTNGRGCHGEGARRRFSRARVTRRSRIRMGRRSRRSGRAGRGMRLLTTLATLGRG